MNSPLKLCLVCLLLAALLCGCGFLPTPANTAQDPTPAPTPEAEPDPEPTPDPEDLARKQRLTDAKDGFLWNNGFLQAIDDEGNPLTDRYIGVSA